MKTVIFLFLLCTRIIFAEILPSDRITIWNPGIKSWEEKDDIFSLADYDAAGDGQSDDTQAFKDAINDFSSYGGILVIPAGDYLITEKLQTSKPIIFRGKGKNQTKLYFDLGGKGDNCITIASYTRGTFYDVQSGYSKGSTELVVEYPARFKRADFLEILQDNDPELMYTESNWNQSWAQDAVGQIVRLSHIDGNKLVLESPLHFDYQPAMHPRVRTVGMIVNAGIENLYIERLDAGDGHTIALGQVADSRVQDIESNNTFRTHVFIERSIGCLVTRNYLHHSHDYGDGGHGYGTDIITHTTDCLITDNIYEHLRHSMMTHVGTSGNVFAYNFSVNREPKKLCDISLHGHYANFNLFESNVVHEIDISDYWGPLGPGNTLFRNKVMSEGIEIRDHSHAQNIVGNIIEKGGLTVKSDVKNTLKHGNRIGSRVYWDDDIEDQNIPNSLYLTEKPDFFGDVPWPVFGPEIDDERMIPAQYRYHGIDPTSVKNNDICAPKKFNLKTFPNPFNPQTTIQFDIQKHGRVNVQVYALTGQKVDDIFSGNLSIGTHEMQFRPHNLAAGIYWIQIESGQDIERRKIVFQK